MKEGLLESVVRAIRHAHFNARPQSDFGWDQARAAIRAVALHLDPNAKPGVFLMDMNCSETVANSLLNAIAPKEAVLGGNACHSAEHAVPETTPKGEQRD